MKTSTILRTSLLAAALGAALSAHAVNIALSSFGAVTSFTATTLTVDETVFPGAGQQGGYGPLSTLTYTSTLSFPTTGTGSYTGTGGTLDFSLSITQQVANGSNFEAHGTWTATGGTGTYLNATGSGVFGTAVTTAAALPFSSYTIFRGTIEAVPEPASFAALGVGALAVLRRRKRA